jgi:hypothetical protein
MHLFEGLLSYEIVLLVLGVLLFLALLFLLIFCVITKRSYVGIVPLFLVCIIMLGFPSIQKIKFDNGVLEIEKLTKKVEQNPTNVEAKRELEAKLQKIEGKEISNPSTLRILEKAYTVVGDSPKANIYRKKILIKK